MSWPDDIFGSSPSQESGDSFGGSDADQAMRDHDEALAQLRADRKLTQLLASQEAERASAPSNQSALFPTDQFSMGASAVPDWVGNYVRNNPFGSAASSVPDPLWTGAQPTHQLLKYGIVPFSSQYDAELNPADDWQQRGRDTAAMALSILYPQGGLAPVAAKQPSNNDATGATAQPIAAPAFQQSRADPRVPDEFNATISGGVADVTRPDLQATPNSVLGTSVDPNKPYFPRWTLPIPAEGETGLWRADEPYSWIDENAGQIKNVPRGSPILDTNRNGQPGHFQKGSNTPSGNSWKYRLMPWLGV